MKTIIKSNKNGYFFQIENCNNIAFSSDKSYFLVPSLKSLYKYACDAQKDANKLIKNASYHVFASNDNDEYTITDISAEQMLVNHYLSILNNLNLRAKSSKGDSKENNKIKKEFKMVISELEFIEDKMTDKNEKHKIQKLIKYFKKIRNRIFGIEKEEKIKKASVEKIEEDFKDDVLNNYGQKCCDAIKNNHNGVIYEICGYNKICISEIPDNVSVPLLRISINNNMFVNSILPLTSKISFHSLDFYQKYWKPIVESVGHFYIEDLPLLIVPGKTILPDVPKNSKSFEIIGFNPETKENVKTNISFENEIPLWEIGCKKTYKKASSKYTEEEYSNAIVKCTNPELKSIYNRTGTVTQVIPHADFIEADVDFGRGLGNVRLTEDSFEIIS